MSTDELQEKVDDLNVERDDALARCVKLQGELQALRLECRVLTAGLERSEKQNQILRDACEFAKRVLEESGGFVTGYGRGDAIEQLRRALIGNWNV